MSAVALHDVAPQPVVSIRDRVEEAALPAFLGRSIGELHRRVALLGVPFAGPPFVIYHAFGAVVDAEVCLPVRRPVDASGRIQGRTLPGGRMARIVHVGPYATLAASYALLGDWIRDHHLETAGPVRERYLTGPEIGGPSAPHRTEIELPVAEVPLVVA